MTIWKTDRSGLSATSQDNITESRLISAIPPTDTILLADPLTPTEQRAAIQEQIDTLERQQLLPRVTRESLLGIAVIQATLQSVTEPELYAVNIAYRKTKDFDALIVALRAQMEAIV
jgi:hypothetical protein